MCIDEFVHLFTILKSDEQVKNLSPTFHSLYQCWETTTEYIFF